MLLPIRGRHQHADVASCDLLRRRIAEELLAGGIEILNGTYRINDDHSVHGGIHQGVQTSLRVFEHLFRNQIAGNEKALYGFQVGMPRDLASNRRDIAGPFMDGRQGENVRRKDTWVPRTAVT